MMTAFDIQIIGFIGLACAMAVVVALFENYYGGIK